MSIVNRRIYHINDLASAIQNGQLCYESSADGDLGYRMWCGKDDEGYITKWLAKNEDAMVGSLWIKCDTTLELDGYLKHDSLGLVSGNHTAVESVTGTGGLVHGPLTFAGDGVVQGGIGNRTFTFTGTGGGGVTDHGGLTGLDDPNDHGWALLVDGSRDLGGNWSFGGYDISEVSLLSSVNVSTDGELSVEFGYTWGTGRYGISMYSRYGASGAESGLDILDNGTTALYSTGGGRVATTASLLAFSDKSFSDSADWTSGEINMTASGTEGVAEVDALYALGGNTEKSIAALIAIAASGGGGGLDAAYRFNFDSPVYSNKITVDTWPFWVNIAEDLNGFEVTQYHAANTEALFYVTNDSVTEDGAQVFNLTGDAGSIDVYGHRFAESEGALSLVSGTADHMYAYLNLQNIPSGAPCESDQAIAQLLVEDYAQTYSNYMRVRHNGITLNCDSGDAALYAQNITLSSDLNIYFAPASGYSIYMGSAPVVNIKSAGFTAPYSLGTISGGSITADFSANGNYHTASLTADATSFTFTTPQGGTYFLRMTATSADRSVSGFPAGIKWHGTDPDGANGPIVIPSGKVGTLVLTHYGSGDYDGSLSVEGED